MATLDSNVAIYVRLQSARASASLAAASWYRNYQQAQANGQTDEVVRSSFGGESAISRTFSG
jgi:hypothetical protein